MYLITWYFKLLCLESDFTETMTIIVDSSLKFLPKIGVLYSFELIIIDLHDVLANGDFQLLNFLIYSFK